MQQRQCFHEDQVRGIFFKHTREQLNGCQSLRAVDVAVDTECHGTVIFFSRLLHGLPRDLDSQPGGVHPMPRCPAPAGPGGDFR